MRTARELDQRRKELGLTHLELSVRSGVSVPTIQKIFSGTTASPRFGTLKKLEAVLFSGWESLPDGPEPYSTVLCEPSSRYRAKTRSGNHIPTDGSPEGSLRVYDPNDWIRRLGKPQGTFTIEDVEKIPEDQHYELIDGVLIRLESPSFEHQRLSLFIAAKISAFAEEEGCDCVVLTAPFDVQLDRDQKTLVEPDVLVICNEENVTDKRGVGAPDLCIEILSPSTRSKDQLLKRYKYEHAGVKEFWIVDPEYRRIIVHRFDLKKDSESYTFEDKVPIGLCDGKHVIDFSKYRTGFHH